MFLNDMCTCKPTQEDRLSVTLEAIKIMENLVELTEEDLSMYGATNGKTKPFKLSNSKQTTVGH